MFTRYYQRSEKREGEGSVINFAMEFIPTLERRWSSGNRKEREIAIVGAFFLLRLGREKETVRTTGKGEGG